MERGIEKYYATRASEYDQVYLRPERQPDLRNLELVVSNEFRGLNVLEIACGTGYWTQFIAKTARRVTAIDSSREVIEFAKKRDYGNCPVSFILSDAYVLTDVGYGLSGGFCGFWWSHIPRKRRKEFLRSFHSHLSHGAIVVIIDNRFVEGSSTPINRQDDDGNTYQLRKLTDGTVHELLKNFPTEEELKNSFAEVSASLKIVLLEYYWMVSYRTR